MVVVHGFKQFEPFFWEFRVVCTTSIDWNLLLHLNTTPGIGFEKREIQKFSSAKK
jgi:hypothetical protein